jgi:hypothetical protein
VNHRSLPRHAAVALVLATLVALPASARQLAAIDALARAPANATAKSVAALAQPDIELDTRLGVPRFLWGTQAGSVLAAEGRAPSQKSALDPEAVARAYLRDVADLYRISAAEIDALQMHDQQRFPAGGGVVRFRGRIDGIEVFREEVNVVYDRDGGLVAIGGFAMGAPPAKRAAVDPFASGPETAIATALADWRFPASVGQALTLVRDADGYRHYELAASRTSDDGSSLAIPVRVKRVWFRLPDELLPAYYIEVQMRDALAGGEIDAYAYVVSAVDNTVLYRHHQTADAAFTFRVYAEPTSPFLPLPGPMGRAAFPNPTATPDGAQPPLLPGNLVTLESAPFSRNDPWLVAAANRTQGNNVEAFSNLLAPDGYGTPGVDECNLALPVDGDLHACITSPGTFDHVYNFGAAPNASRAQVAAGVTNLFYMINWLHDWYYDAGFNEAAGNAQTTNYGRGGIANDSIFAEAQDYSGTNNANMTTPADGQRPRMRTYLWSSPARLASVLAPSAIAGAKATGTAEFGAQVFDLSGTIVPARDAADTTGPSTTDGCTAYTNAAAVAGNIALVDRGTCLFVDKAKNAQAAGAAALVVVNNVSGGAPGMAGTDASITIPVASISLEDGAAIRSVLAQPAAVNMRLARVSGVPRDGALDNSTIAHEWGHYISNRLVGNANGLTANQGGGLGEGWADFHALLLLVKEADRSIASNASFDGTYAVTQYALGGPDFAPDVLNYAYYFGIRRYPYSRDMTRNPLTFRHISDGVALPTSAARSPRASGAVNSEVHNTGEVWASMLWECYSNLLNDPGRLTFAQAQDRMKRYLVAAYKVTPLNPTFITARDALLAVMQAQDPADRDLCMRGFAKRGAGVGAVAPDSFSADNAGVVESFRATADALAPAPVVEYYHASFDHYFVTSIPDEIMKLDNGTVVGWVRTGESFKAYASGTTGAADVCRFFSASFTPKSSHFYTPDAVECASVKRNPNWQFEAVVFAMPTPDTSGKCPAGTQPVYRLYNNGQGAAPNHRYTTSLATRTTMQGKGWIAEGYGALGVIACSPL